MEGWRVDMRMCALNSHERSRRLLEVIMQHDTGWGQYAGAGE